MVEKDPNSLDSQQRDQVLLSSISLSLLSSPYHSGFVRRTLQEDEQEEEPQSNGNTVGGGEDHGGESANENPSDAQSEETENGESTELKDVEDGGESDGDENESVEEMDEAQGTVELPQNEEKEEKDGSGDEGDTVSEGKTDIAWGGDDIDGDQIDSKQQTEELNDQQNSNSSASVQGLVEQEVDQFLDQENPQPPSPSEAGSNDYNENQDKNDDRPPSYPPSKAPVAFPTRFPTMPPTKPPPTLQPTNSPTTPTDPCHQYNQSTIEHFSCQQGVPSPLVFGTLVFVPLILICIFYKYCRRCCCGDSIKEDARGEYRAIAATYGDASYDNAFSENFSDDEEDDNAFQDDSWDQAGGKRVLELGTLGKSAKSNGSGGPNRRIGANGRLSLEEMNG
jgi:hypothetical protein